MLKFKLELVVVRQLSGFRPMVKCVPMKERSCAALNKTWMEMLLYLQLCLVGAICFWTSTKYFEPVQIFWTGTKGFNCYNCTYGFGLRGYIIFTLLETLRIKLKNNTCC